MADKYFVIANKSLKVGDFKVKSSIFVLSEHRLHFVFHYPLSEATKLKSWYDSEGIETYMAAIVSGMTPSANNGSRSMYSDRVCLSHFTTNPYLGEEKPDQAMWYRACKTCNKKVTETVDTGYWYIMEVKVSDSTGEAWFSAFNVEAEKMIGCTTDELNMLKSEEGEANQFQTKLKEATWSSHLFRVSVSQQEYNSEKRQRITVRRVSPIDFLAKTRLLLQDVSKNKKTSQYFSYGCHIVMETLQKSYGSVYGVLLILIFLIV
ncbi:BnaA01g25450D [Brassica napus]|uniref:BnaA01g25450D protein n=1 Tax=Brassica napus TaxID=3708 RepID=A0A078HG37_BRANA|nr:BnaA01g25450D [Brassica napus]